MKIISNGVRRPIVWGHELTPKEVAWFKDLFNDVEDRTYVRYKGETYLMDDFSRIVPQGKPRYNPLEVLSMSKEMDKWDGFLSDSFFSGVVVRYSDDPEMVVMGTVIA